MRGLHRISRLRRTRRRIRLGVGSFAGVFEAVNHHAVGIGLKMERMPVKGGDLNPAAGRRFQAGDQLLANEALEGG